MNFKQFLLTGLASVLLGSAGAHVYSNQAQAATFGAHEFRDYSVQPKENLTNLLNASHYYKAMAKESGATFYQNKLNQAIHFAKKQQKSNNDSQVVTAINKLSVIYNEVFQLHLQTEKGSADLQNKKAELQSLITKANSLLTESHLSMNQDEAQLKQTVSKAHSVLSQTTPDFELVNAIHEVQQAIQKVEAYKAITAQR
ncbi:complement inhibitor SCIN family protein [Staphylococcus simulans]|uniref:complement inhibitor SCIN family protein n=1 Tax=Staphylococcus simulans TaxID=1286 RepID=UPI00399AF1E6